jgi:hypothetical protein
MNSIRHFFWVCENEGAAAAVLWVAHPACCGPLAPLRWCRRLSPVCVVVVAPAESLSSRSSFARVSVRDPAPLRTGQHASGEARGEARTTHTRHNGEWTQERREGQGAHTLHSMAAHAPPPPLHSLRGASAPPTTTCLLPSVHFRTARAGKGDRCRSSATRWK